MLNRWKPFPKYKPKKSGWYICSIRYGEEEKQAYVMDLFWNELRETWQDKRRANVFQTYKVIGWGLDLIDRPCETQIWHDDLCERNDVIAFKKLPKIYK